MSLFSKVLALTALAGLLAGGAYVRAGRALGPSIDLHGPERYVGQTSVLAFSVDALEGTITSVEAVLQQGETRVPLFSLDAPGEARVEQETLGRIRIVRRFDRNVITGVTEGAAQLTVTAIRPTFYGLRQALTSLRHPLELRFEPRRLTGHR